MKKAKPFFPSNSPVKVELLWSPPFLKIWLQVQTPLSPPPSRQKGWGGAHYGSRIHAEGGRGKNDLPI